MILKVHLADKYVGLRPFLFAGYRKIIVPQVPVADKRICFDGSHHIETARMVHDGDKKEIVIFMEREGEAQLNLNSRESIFHLLHSQRGFRYSQQVEAKILESHEVEESGHKKRRRRELTDDEFFEFIKMSCARRKWHHDIFKRKESTYKLFASASQGIFSFIETLYSLEKDVPLPVLFSSFITFLGKVQTYKEIKDSMSNARYKIDIRKAKNLFESKIQSCLNDLIRMDPQLPLGVRVLSFFIGLRS